nr:hypothetical protein [Myxococcus sp. RHSTA-1-4]
MKKTSEPARTNLLGLEEPAPGTSSSSGTVPSAVPLLTHGSRPRCEASALKNRLPWVTISPSGAALAAPGSRSTTRRVPTSVPSLTHSSRPCVPSSAAKKRRAPMTVRPLGNEPASPARRSFTRCVPSGVPSLRHSSASVPASPVVALKYSRPPMATSPRTSENSLTGFGAPPSVTIRWTFASCTCPMTKNRRGPAAVSDSRMPPSLGTRASSTAPGPPPSLRISTVESPWKCARK